VAFFKEGVEVGQEALAKLEHLPAHRLVGFPKDPGLWRLEPFIEWLRQNGWKIPFPKHETS
jgi:hypothetical protein